MKLYTALINNEEEILVELLEGYVYRLNKLAELAPQLRFKDMNELILNWNEELKDKLSMLANNADVLEGAWVELDKVELCAPILRPLQDMVCLGINYGDHAAEAGRFSNEAFGGERPYTIYFSKRVTKAVAPNGFILSHQDMVESLDYECELGVILGKDCYGATLENALDYVFGYTIVNDISARNVQTRHKQWYLGKSLDGFTPIGPCITLKDDIKDVQKLDISCKVNGQLRQNSNTECMLQTVAGAIVELSQGMTLAAGTIIATGTPSGVGMGMQPPCFLKPGDVVSCYVEGIGVLENTVK